ncbi:hydroxysqualene dehydroxylase [Oceanobacillus damuensis]|uniref:hydroxysqualene dehydroxylase n=1 Tax=Oceanobacillus damuensis TaxID=937928 RepID=UPI001F16A97C|nr:FAD-dependent oxidoreductase [Oceanobacillus damuensis]
MDKYDVVIVGGGLAGLSTALELADKRKKVLLLEANPYLGGRTSSFNDNGMEVESGFHRLIGYHTEILKMLGKAGVNPDEIFTWEEDIEIRSVKKKTSAVFGVAPVFNPLKTLKGVTGNNRQLSPRDKISLLPFFTNGLKDYGKHPKILDEMTIGEYAKKHGVTENAFHFIIESFSSGLYFLSPERYSAYVFFGLIAPGIPKSYKMRIGAFLGGMTDIMCNPVARAIERKGGEVRTGVKVKELCIDETGSVTGVKTEEGEQINGNHVVLATTLFSAKQILLPEFGDHSWFEPMFKLPVMPAVTFQMELTKRALPKDRTTFGPGTVLSSFSEQSRTTFRHAYGRLSIILSEPEQFLDMTPEQTLKIVLEDTKRLGMDLDDHVFDYRQINHHFDFHSLEPGNNWLRPEQDTPVTGLVLAGDYTMQPYFATMEGAVVSGKKAAEAILKNKVQVP